MTDAFWLVVGVAALAACSFVGARLSTTAMAAAVVLVAWTAIGTNAWAAVLIVWLFYAVIVLLFGNAALRRRWLTGPTLRWFRKALPELSESERIALNAGTVSWEGELFSGVPDWRQLERLPPPRLSVEEQQFIDGPLQSLLKCLADDIQASDTGSPHGISDAIWRQLKGNGFLGLAIPAEFGGLGFSAGARSCILAEVASAPGGDTLGPVIATANGLGPAQLLLTCGTQPQKARYLPRLARGDDMPCFAVTSDWAGTDAAAVNDVGIICEYDKDGERQLGIRLNWHKRHITLAPAATLIGLAVRLHDPDGLLGDAPQPGLSCVLVAADTPGIDNSRYHKPVGAAFPYGPTQGRNVLVPLDAVIGGPDMIGQGWRLLMEQLPTGRAIAIPSAAAGSCAGQARLAGAYARIRRQFGRPIGSFEGMEEVLARIGGHAYACEAVRQLAANTVDLGERPAIAAAIAKYHCSTRAQQVAVDSMTLLAGKAACAGPRNPVASTYAAAPLAATVDGTNIFTRSTLIFGQGGIRCHPFLQAEIAAAEHPDWPHALAAFDAVLPRHIGHVLTMATRAVVLGLTGGRGSSGGQSTAVRRHRQRINRYAAALAVAADLAMATTGDNLRYRENISGRLGDVLSQLYIASAVLQRWQRDGRHRTDLHLVQWVCEDCFAAIEQQLPRILRRLRKRPLAWAARLLIFPLGRHADGPGDNCSHRVATILQTPGDTQKRLLPRCYVHPEATHGVALFDAALQAAADTSALRKRLQRAIQRGELRGESLHDRLDEACELGLLDATEERALRQAQALHDAVIQVDSFAAQERIHARCGSQVGHQGGVNANRG